MMGGRGRQTQVQRRGWDIGTWETLRSIRGLNAYKAGLRGSSERPGIAGRIVDISVEQRLACVTLSPADEGRTLVYPLPACRCLTGRWLLQRGPDSQRHAPSSRDG